MEERHSSCDTIVSHANGQKPTLFGERRFRCALSAESCIRKAVAERGLTPGLVGLADAKAEDEPRERAGYGIYGICKQRLDWRARRPRGSP
jgi:hypothetical protein